MQDQLNYLSPKENFNPSAPNHLLELLFPYFVILRQSEFDLHGFNFTSLQPFYILKLKVNSLGLLVYCIKFRFIATLSQAHTERRLTQTVHFETFLVNLCY